MIFETVFSYMYIDSKFWKSIHYQAPLREKLLLNQGYLLKGGNKKSTDREVRMIPGKYVISCDNKKNNHSIQITHFFKYHI